LAAELLRVNAHSPEPNLLRYAADFLTRGRVVAVPTDTVYGLAADPFNLSAVEEIYRVKGRPETRALPILVNSIDQAMLLARDVPENFLRLAHEFWPGALTLVVDAGHRLPLKVTANTGRVALRLPRSAVIAALIDEFDGPITGTSANLSGHPSCISGTQVQEQLGSRLPLILDVGDLGTGRRLESCARRHHSWCGHRKICFVKAIARPETCYSGCRLTSLTNYNFRSDAGSEPAKRGRSRPGQQ
jgi:tRNA threonylcarbamoyl adenosine modification protein (Sua5/YciO/YrdC/YwlC family)